MNGDNPRKYGPPPYRLLLIHGGPGAGGSLTPLAMALSADFSLLEPVQTAHSIEGQVAELRAVVENEALPPVVLAGHSWGAWLAFIFAARYPNLVEKLILIGAGPFLESYKRGLMKRRFSRLSGTERTEVKRYLEAAGEPDTVNLSRFAELMALADAYDPIPDLPLIGEFQPEIFRAVSPEAQALRKSGHLLSMGSGISCPVVALHGLADPHPIEGVETPLRQVLKDFKMIPIPRCGHYPWLERQAAEPFLQLLRQEIRNRKNSPANSYKTQSPI